MRPAAHLGLCTRRLTRQSGTCTFERIAGSDQEQTEQSVPDPLHEALDPVATDAFDPNGEPDTAPAATPSAAAAAPEAAAASLVGAPPASDPQPRNPNGTFAKPESKIPAYLRGQAQDLGWADSFIDTFETDQLGVAIRLAHQSLSREREALGRQRVVADDIPDRTPPPEPKDELLDLGLDDAGNPITDADVSPVVLRLLKKQAEELRAIKKGHAEFTTREQQRQARNTTMLVDEAFEALGESDHKLFGKGSVNELAQDAAERKRRMAVYREAGIDPENDTPRTIARKIKAARETLFPAEAPRPAENAYEPEAAPPPAKKKPTVGEWNDGAVVKPTQRKDDDLPLGRERAIRAVARHQNGQMTAAEKSELEGLPD